jgi:tRNA uridine 5-carboxymethylaminomethyl modification enzyme
MNDLLIPEHLEDHGLTSISYEAREKLQAVRPYSLGQAGRIPGVSPSDLQSLVFEILKRRNPSRTVSRETVNP